MHYYIDGYNLLFRTRLREGDLKTQRESIIHDINKKISLINLDSVSIVFDAAYREGLGSRSHFDNLEILFSAQGETADEYILNQLKYCAHPKRETIITSDKTLARLVRHFGAKTQTIEEFTQWLDRLYTNKSLPSKPIKPTQLPALVVPISKPIPKIQSLVDDYEDIFEKKWQELVQQEQQLEQEKIQLQMLSSKRKPKLKKKDPFVSAPLSEPSATNETERWLKIFEQRFKDKN